jgi:hypothetical protein
LLDAGHPWDLILAFLFSGSAMINRRLRACFTQKIAAVAAELNTARK